MARRAAAVAVSLVVLVATTGPGHAEPTSGGAGEADADAAPQDAPEDEPDPAEVAREQAKEALQRSLADLDAARAALQTRLEGVAAARRAGRAADGEVRRTEAALPDAVTAVADAVTAVADAEEALDDARRAVRRLERRRDQLEVELADAKDTLGDRALQAFKTGHLAEFSGPVAIAREAHSPGDLAHHLKQLRGLTRDGARSVGELDAALAQAIVDLDEAIGQEAEAIEEEAEAVMTLEGARSSREEREAAAAAVRARAVDAESRLLAAMDGELAARDRVATTLERVVEATAEAVASDVAAARTEAALARTERVAETLEEGDEPRAEQVAGRRRAHQRQVALPAEHRRVADGWHCPVTGGRFVNDWSFPRSGDRRHEGTDVFAPRGTAIVALADGIVTALERVDRSGSLGGRTVSVTTADDHRHYYAHLETIPAELTVGAAVAAGDAIGTVGTSGNARGTPPHLHLGWYVRDTAVNPYASLVVACRDAD